MSPKCFLVLLFLGVVVVITPSIASEPKPTTVEEAEEQLENTFNPKRSHKPKPPTEAPLPSPKHHHKPPTGAPSPSPKHHHHPHQKTPAEAPKIEEEALDNKVVKTNCPPKQKPQTEAPAPSPKHQHHHHHKPPTKAPSPKHHHHLHRKVSPSPAPSVDSEQPIIYWQG